jgi:hypothetical protein
MLKIREYAKAIAALLGAVATFLVSVNAPAEWATYIGSVVAILTGVATFGIPNRPAAPAEVPPPPPLPDVVLGGVQQAADNVAQSVSDLDQIRDGVGQILGTVPGVGPLAQAAIDSFKIPRL